MVAMVVVVVLGGSGGGGTWWWSLIARVSWGSQGCLVSGIFVGWHLVGGVDAKKRGTRSKGP